MYVYNTTKVHSIIFISCIFFTIISPSYNTTIVQAKSEEKTSGGMASGVVQTVSNNGETDKIQQGILKTSNIQNPNKEGKVQQDTEVRKCDAECKVDKLIEVGIIPEIAESLVANCKALADDPRKCVLVGASIVTAESSGGKNCRKNNQYNCFGIMQSNNYKSYSDATLHFAGKFQKWWRNAKSMEFFYPKRGETSPSRYCVSEHSSNSSKGCENGLKNSSAVFNKLNKLF